MLLKCGVTSVLDKVRVDVKKSVSILVLISIPVVLYLLVRIPALQSSFSGHNGGAYDPTKGDVVGNALLYLAQPFLVGAVELVSAEQVPKSQWITALVLHFTLLLAIIHRYGWKAGALYLAGYFVFLLPVLPVAIVGAHYLYGSGIVFAVALGLLVSQTEGRWRLLYSGLGMALLAVGFAHSLKIQSQMKSDGQCQILMLNQLDEIIQAEKQAGKSKLVIVPDSNAPGYIAARRVMPPFFAFAKSGVRRPKRSSALA